jgi:GNAT superfamily N-acetyltransferase
MTGSLRGSPDAPVRIEPEMSAAFEAVFVDRAFGEDDDAAERLAAMARIPEPRGFAVAMADGAAAAIGVCAIESPWAGVLGMRTLPGFRREGLARRIFRALGAYATTYGVSHGYLQVEAANAWAVALYESEGFMSAYRYRYWTRQTPARP